ncbi:MAG: amidohydrolase family protein [Proteobacteria bacterium]|nr:amidohydrolase family protein [Pseudomonadota bacterium]MBU1737391.1 amidohydrolase family protein [Pseudomonadota bacterium]
MGETRFIVAGSFIDGNGGEVRKNVFLAVKDSLITAIGRASDLPGSDPAAIDDFSHCIILPPLVDCSVSLARSPSIDRRVRLSVEEGGLTKMAVMVEQHIHDCHTHGVLGVADSDGPADLPVRDRKESVQGGGINIRTSGVDFLRIDYSGSIDDQEGPTPRLTREGLSGLLQHRDGQMAVVVANGRQQVAEALAAGCDAIEQGYGMGEGNLREMAERQVLWIPEVLRARNSLDGSASGGEVGCRFSLRYVAPGKPNPGAEKYWKKILAEQLAQLALARKLGVTTAVGTGAGSVGILHGESMVEEMKLFLKAGFSLAETIRSASENGAKFFAMDNLGALAVGRKATFLIARGTAKQLPRKLAYLEGIYVDGIPSSIYRKNPVKMIRDTIPC